MSEVDDVTLKSYFESGDEPTEAEFEDLVDSKQNINEDYIVPVGKAVKNQLGDKIINEYGVIRYTKVSIAGNYPVVNGDTVIIADASSGNITVSIPPADSDSDGRLLQIKKIDATAFTVTISSSGTGDTIDGSSSEILASQYDSLSIFCDGTEWFIL